MSDTKNSQEEIKELKRAVLTSPGDPIVHYNLGLAYYNLNRHKESVDAYKQAIAVYAKGDFAEAYYGLGLAYDQLDRYQESIDALKQAIRIKPDFAEAHNYLKLVCERWVKIIQPSETSHNPTIPISGGHSEGILSESSFSDYTSSENILEQQERISAHSENIGVMILVMFLVGTTIFSIKYLNRKSVHVPEIPHENSSVTKEESTSKQVTRGMTMEEVKQILGPPGNAYSMYGVPNEDLLVWQYHFKDSKTYEEKDWEIQFEKPEGSGYSNYKVRMDMTF